MTVTSQTTKSPFVASALSVFLPGAGQLYAERTERGLAVMVSTLALTPVSMYLGLGLWAWQVFDAATWVHGRTSHDPGAS